MKRRFYFTLLVLAILLFALPGFVAKGFRRLRNTRGFSPWPPQPVAWARAGR
jgi:hypothetical protein